MLWDKNGNIPQDLGFEVSGLGSGGSVFGLRVSGFEGWGRRTGGLR